MRKFWMKKFASFKKAEKADEDYYLKMSPEERLDIVQFLREQYCKIKGKKKDESSAGLRRIIKIIRQT